MTQNTFYKNCSRPTLCKLWAGENGRGRSDPPRQFRNTFYKNCSRPTLCKLWTGRNGRGRSDPPRQLLGKSKDVNDRLNGYHHKHQSVMARCKKSGGFPAYYIGVIRVAGNTGVSADDLTRVESAIISDRNPILNDTADKKFHHPETVVNKSGRPTEKGDSEIPAGFGRPTIHIQEDEEKQQVA